MKYAARRLFSFLLTMVIVSFLAFMAFDLISGDPATALLGTEATPEAVAALRAEMGLDAHSPFATASGCWAFSPVTLEPLTCITRASARSSPPRSP